MYRSLSTAQIPLHKMCTREDALAHNLGALYDVMSYNALTTLCSLETGNDAGGQLDDGLQILLPKSWMFWYHLWPPGPGWSETDPESKVSLRSCQFLALLQRPVRWHQSGKTIFYFWRCNLEATCSQYHLAKINCFTNQVNANPWIPVHTARSWCCSSLKNYV